MITLEPLTKNDLQEIKTLQPEGWGDILPFIEFYTRELYCFPVKAQLDTKIVGTGTAIIYGDTAWLAHIIVIREQRNKGIGKIITQSLLEIVKTKGCSTVLLLATAVGEPVYRQSGFVVDTEYLFFKDGLTSSSPAMNIIPFEESYLQPILDLDYSITGEKRAILLTNHLPHTQLVVDNGTLTACYFPTLGEGFILATESSAGLTLLNLKHKSMTRTVIPIDNKIAVEFLIKNGFEAHLKCSRMRLGKPLPSWKPQNIYSRAGGNIG